MIPEAAVEAAAKVIYRTSGLKRTMNWDAAREDCEDQAAEILQAAAPHLWGPNPYRTTK